MYDELVKSIHCCFGDDSIQTDCENCMMKDKREEHNYVGCCDALGLAAAEAIEELSSQLDDFKRLCLPLKENRLYKYSDGSFVEVFLILPSEPPKED